MRIPKVGDFLVEHYFSENRDSATMMLGEPGIGKSRAVYEAAEKIANKLDLELVDYSDEEGEKLLDTDKKVFILHSLPLVEVEPTDITGIPKENGRGFIRFRPLLWAKLMSRNPGILLLDDFMDAQRPDLFSAAYKITLERRAGYVKLDPGVMVVGASNTPENSSLSQMLPAPLANRMIMISCNRPTLEEWAKWMNKKYENWDRRVYLFLKRFETENYLLRPPKEPEVVHNFPTPRSFTRLALEKTNEPEVIDGFIGPEVGEKFHAFTKVTVDINELIKNPELWEKQSLDGKYMLCLELATFFSKNSKKKKNAVEKAFPLLKKMSDESKQFAVLTFLCIPRSKLAELFKKLFAKMPEYVKIVEQVLSDKDSIGG